MWAVVEEVEPDSVSGEVFLKLISVLVCLEKARENVALDRDAVEQ